MRNEVNLNGDDDHDNEEPCNNINNRSMDYKDNEYRRRIGIFHARSGPTRGQLEREKVVPFLLPNNHIHLDDQDNAQVVVPPQLILTKRVRFSCSYERRIEPHSEMSKAEKDRLWCVCVVQRILMYAHLNRILLVYEVLQTKPIWSIQK